MKRLGLLLVLTITVALSYGQQRTIDGTVTSAVDGQPVKGVKIVLLEESVDSKRNEIIRVETKIKTMTDGKGQYKLTVPDTWENVVRFQKRPFTTMDVKLNDRTQLDLSMTLTVRQINE